MQFQQNCDLVKILAAGRIDSKFGYSISYIMNHYHSIVRWWATMEIKIINGYVFKNYEKRL